MTLTENLKYTEEGFHERFRKTCPKEGDDFGNSVRVREGVESIFYGPEVLTLSGFHCTALRDALFKRYKYTEEGFHERFRKTCPKEGDDFGNSVRVREGVESITPLCVCVCVCVVQIVSGMVIYLACVSGRG